MKRLDVQTELPRRIQPQHVSPQVPRGKTPRAAQPNTAPRFCAHTKLGVAAPGTAGEGEEGTPSPPPPDASLELRRGGTLLGGCPISFVVTEALTSAPWLDGRSH